MIKNTIHYTISYKIGGGIEEFVSLQTHIDMKEVLNVFQRLQELSGFEITQCRKYITRTEIRDLPYRTYTELNFSREDDNA